MRMNPHKADQAQAKGGVSRAEFEAHVLTVEQMAHAQTEIDVRELRVMQLKQEVEMQQLATEQEAQVLAQMQQRLATMRSTLGEWCAAMEACFMLSHDFYN